MTTIVIVRHEENLRWIFNISSQIKIYVVQKGIHMENTGRESLSYLWFINRFYDELDGLYFFVQGNPYAHRCPTFDEQTGPLHFGHWKLTNEDGSPDHTGIEVGQFAKEIGIEMSYPAEFWNGAQFLVSDSDIRSRPKEFYQKLIEMHSRYRHAPWIMERLWNWIFPSKVRLAPW